MRTMRTAVKTPLIVILKSSLVNESGAQGNNACDRPSAASSYSLVMETDGNCGDRVLADAVSDHQIPKTSLSLVCTNYLQLCCPLAQRRVKLPF